MLSNTRQKGTSFYFFFHVSVIIFIVSSSYTVFILIRDRIKIDIIFFEVEVAFSLL